MASMAYYNREYAPPTRTNTFSSTMSSNSASTTSTFQPPSRELSAFSELTMNQKEDTNIVNRIGNKGNSLYQSCLALRKRLAYVPGFDDFLAEMDIEEQQEEEEVDPVSSVWNLLRRGEPLMTIYNALQPAKPLTLARSTVSQKSLGKAATFKFLQACLEELGFPPGECFLITDLYGTDTTGFVKVLKVINRVIDLLGQRGLLMGKEEALDFGDAGSAQGRSRQENIIHELVTTERTYVQHLETLLQFKNQLNMSGMIPGDVIHDIFLNLGKLVDFQRRFLIRIEQQNQLDSTQQNWGNLFVAYQESFEVYEPFIANSMRCNEIVMREWDKIKAVPLPPAFQGMVEAQIVLTGFLLKPFQRLAKYPLLLEDLAKKSNFSEEQVHLLLAGSEAMKTVLDRANVAIEKIKMNEEVEELKQLVDDWKGHKMENFGELVCCGAFPVLKGEGSKETEREYKIYLFERILLCCKELNPKKEKNRLASKGLDKRGKTKLQLKGRIFMQNVTDVISTPKAGNDDSDPDNIYRLTIVVKSLDHQLLQIWWKGDPGIETFVIKFKHTSDKEKWASTVENLRNLLRTDRATMAASTSQTKFISLQGQELQNPYQEDEDQDEDDVQRLSQATTLNGSGNYGDFSASRNASNSSLRSRSTTGGSGGPTGRGAPPPRFPLPEPLMGFNSIPLKLSTGGISDGVEGSDERFASHFSPTIDSPMSTRTSSQPGTYPFPRQSTPTNGAWHADGNKHNTAPPMSRPNLRDDDGNGYGANGRSVQRPSLPAMTATQSAHQLNLAHAQHRSRSLSSPDPQNVHGSPQRRLPNGQMSAMGDDVPVPSIPAHLASMRAPINRSQNNSPTDSLRTSRTQSSNPMRGPSQQYQPNSYGYDQFPQQNPRSDPRYPSVSAMGTGASRVLSPPLSGMPAQQEGPVTPTQLKVKIHFDPNPSHVTIVVPVIIKHRSLIDRIDSKMEKVSSSSISKGSARLRYKDQEGEFVLIENDEDVSMAIEDWQEGNVNLLKQNNVNIPDFDLYWKDTVTTPNLGNNNSFAARYGS